MHAPIVDQPALGRAHLEATTLLEVDHEQRHHVSKGRSRRLVEQGCKRDHMVRGAVREQCRATEGEREFVVGLRIADGMHAARAAGRPAGPESQAIFGFGMDCDAGHAKRITRYAGDVVRASVGHASAGPQPREPRREFPLEFGDFAGKRVE